MRRPMVGNPGSAAVRGGEGRRGGSVVTHFPAILWHWNPSDGDTMTLEITLAPDEEARLRERAAALGLDIQAFAREALIEKIDRPSFAQLLAPIHEATRRSG